MRYAVHSTIDEIVSVVEGNLVVGSNASLPSSQTEFFLADIYSPKSEDLVFLFKVSCQNYLKSCDNLVVFLEEGMKVSSCSHIFIFVSDVRKAYDLFVRRFLSHRLGRRSFSESRSFIHPTAQVHSSVSLGKDVFVDAHVVVGKNSIIGDCVSLGKGVVLGEEVCLEERVSVFSYSTLYNFVFVGSGTKIGSYCSIGDEGFGFYSSKEDEKMHILPHIGSVKIGKGSWIGNFVGIARGTIRDTVIGDFVGLDNNVHIAHNVCVGSCTYLVGHISVAGSVSIGERCHFAGNGALNRGLSITDGVVLVLAGSLLVDIKKPGSYSVGSGSLLKIDSPLKWRSFIR